jgi:hypothetical protein
VTLSPVNGRMELALGTMTPLDEAVPELKRQGKGTET